MGESTVLSGLEPTGPLELMCWEGSSGLGRGVTQSIASLPFPPMF